jgi:O-acetylhomoserine (thiol)-lyase
MMRWIFYISWVGEQIVAEFETRAIHSPYIKPDPHGALQFPIYDGAAFEFETAEDIEKAFNGQKLAHTYSRITNPTVENFEQRVKNITRSQGVAALSSGMAAISNLILTICESGDNIITTKYLFGNTYSLFEKTLKPWGFQARYADLKNIKDIEGLIDNRTRAIFLETITNPQLEIVDIKLISEISRHHGIPVIADSTMTPLCFFQPRELGIDIEAISATKYISGGAAAVGGLIIDHGTYDWRKIPKLSDDARKHGPMTLLVRLKREVYRNLGACLSPHNAFLLSLGLESTKLRIEKSCSNAMTIGTYISELSKIVKVNYSGLEISPDHNIAKKQFNDKYGGLLTFNLQDKAECFRFINQLKLIKRATNINDNKTLIIHPASTIFCEYSQKLREEMGVPDNLIRLSLGIEEPADLIADIKQALEVV